MYSVFCELQSWVEVGWIIQTIEVMHFLMGQVGLICKLNYLAMDVTRYFIEIVVLVSLVNE